AETWCPAVLTEMNSCAAISALLSPAQIRPSTSRSRWVSRSGSARVAARGPAGIDRTPSDRSRCRAICAAASAPRPGRRASRAAGGRGGLCGGAERRRRGVVGAAEALPLRRGRGPAPGQLGLVRAGQLAARRAARAGPPQPGRDRAADPAVAVGAAVVGQLGL